MNPQWRRKNLHLPQNRLRCQNLDLLARHRRAQNIQFTLSALKHRKK